jgi:CubicO group peptidase (beta-lactamase class C family)
MRIGFRFLTGSLLAALSVSDVRAQAAEPDQRLAGFDEYVARAVREWNTAGLAVAVVKDGRVVFQKTYGVREIGKPDAVDSATIFSIASTTKAMTSAAVGMLVDEGKLGWDDPVTKFVPGLQLYDPYVTRELTVRDLLTHRAGLNSTDFLWTGDDLTPDEIFRRLSLVRPAYSLRSSFIYQNVMYALAGEVVAKASGMPWEKFVESRIFLPLGMRRTFATKELAANQVNAASPHWRFGDTLTVIENTPTSGIAPAGGAWSSIADMSKWVRFLLDSGKVGSTRLLRAETFAELFTPQTVVPPDEFYVTAQLTKPHWMTYGLGWFQQDYRGRMVNFHTGSLDGTVALIGLMPEERLGVYVLANTDHVEVRHALMLRVFDLFLGPPVRDWSSELRGLYAGRQARSDSAARVAESRRIKGTRPSLPLEKYVGRYSDPLHGVMEVTLDRGRLRARFGAHNLGTLEHYQYDTFRLRWDHQWDGTRMVIFTIGAAGVPETANFGSFTLKRSRQ